MGNEQRSSMRDESKRSLSTTNLAETFLHCTPESWSGRFAEPLRGIVGVPKELNLESRRDSVANHRFSEDSSLSFRKELSQENEAERSVASSLNGRSGIVGVPNKDSQIDSVVQSVLDQYIQRSMVGKKKYGTTMDRDDLSIGEWIQHTQEELMDATLYLEKLKRTLIAKNIG